MATPSGSRRRYPGKPYIHRPAAAANSAAGHPISFWLITAGIISGLVAAVFGLADWTIIPAGTRAKRVGTLHGLGNVMVVGLFFVSWLLRLHPGHQPGVVAYICSFAGAGLALVTGWLGGELVARLGVGVADGANVNAPSSLSGRPAEGAAPGD